MKPAQVQRALAQHEETRVTVMAKFKARGGVLNRWERSDRLIMAECLIEAEDALEEALHGRQTAARAAIRGVRRQLELEII